MSERRALPDPFVREAEMRDRGSMLPESINGVTSGEFASRSPKHPGTGYEFEQNFAFVGERLVAEWERAAVAADVADRDRLAFHVGWDKAMNGRYPWDCHGVMERKGWTAYPRLRGYQKDVLTWWECGTADATPSTDAATNERKPVADAAD